MKKELNIRIRQKRQECGLTLLEVADLLGVKEATVQRYESGSIKNIKHETICRLAEIFHCSPSWLMGFDMPNGGEKTITLTYEEISTISCYILMTTKFREGEAEAWEKLATEKNPDGSPKFPKAESNAQFWRDMEETLTVIR